MNNDRLFGGLTMLASFIVVEKTHDILMYMNTLIIALRGNAVQRHASFEKRITDVTLGLTRISGSNFIIKYQLAQCQLPESIYIDYIALAFYTCGRLC